MAYRLPDGKFKTTKVTTFATYTANQKAEIDLITARNITFIKGHLKVNYTTDNTSAPDAIEDGVAKLVRNIQLQYNGGAGVPVQALSLQQLALYSKHLLNERIRNDQPPEDTNKTGDAYVDFIISPSLNPRDPQDPRYCIPGEAPTINTMKIAFQWGNEANVWNGGANATINAAELIIDEEAGWTFGPNIDSMKNGLGVDPNGSVFMPLWLTRTEQWSGAYAGLGLAISFPTDVIIRKIFLIVKDNDGNRSDSVVSELAIRTSDNDDLFGVLDWTEAQRVSSWRLDMDPIKGCLLIDCVEDIRDPAYASKIAGLEVKKADKLYVRFSTQAAGSCDVLFDCVRKVKVFE